MGDLSGIKCFEQYDCKICNVIKRFTVHLKLNRRILRKIVRIHFVRLKKLFYYNDQKVFCINCFAWIYKGIKYSTDNDYYSLYIYNNVQEKVTEKVDKPNGTSGRTQCSSISTFRIRVDPNYRTDVFVGILGTTQRSSFPLGSGIPHTRQTPGCPPHMNM